MPMYGVKNRSTSRNQNDFNIDFKHEADQTPTNAPCLEILFCGSRNLWLILLLSGILCKITSSLRIRKNFFDFSWFKLLRALFRFYIIDSLFFVVLVHFFCKNIFYYSLIFSYSVLHDPALKVTMHVLVLSNITWVSVEKNSWNTEIIQFHEFYFWPPSGCK